MSLNRLQRKSSPVSEPLKTRISFVMKSFQRQVIPFPENDGYPDTIRGDSTLQFALGPMVCLLFWFALQTSKTLTRTGTHDT